MKVSQLRPSRSCEQPPQRSRVAERLEAIIRGRPPLGTGAPPLERIEEFLVRPAKLYLRELDLVHASETAVPGARYRVGAPAARPRCAAMKLRILTHAERDLRGTIEDLWPAFMTHDPIVNAFWSRLYEVFPDFQFWVVDEKATIGYACTVPVSWDHLVAEQRGIDWALSDGQSGEPTTLSAVVAALLPEYRGRGISGVLLRRMAGLATAHGLDCMIAPVRPTWKERYPLTPIDRYVKWRREDGFHYDPWIRAHERVGADVLDPAPRSMTITGSRQDWERWTELQFPEDGDYVVPGALVPVRFAGGVGTYVEPNVWMRHPA